MAKVRKDLVEQKCTEIKFNFWKLANCDRTLKIGNEHFGRVSELNLLGGDINEYLKWFSNR